MFDTSQRTFLAQRLGHNVRIHFQGWESSVSKLMGNGWEIQSEYEVLQDRAVMVFTNEHLRLAGYCPSVEFMRRGENHDIHVSHVIAAKQMMIHGHRPNLMPMRLELNEILTPAMVETRFCLADILQPLDVEKLIVAREDEKTVDDLLSHILSKQSALRQEIAERRVKESLIERPSAQIIKLYAS